MQPSRRRLTLILLVFSLAVSGSWAQETSSSTKKTEVLWIDPGDIRTRNLYWGPGGEEHQPKTPVQFVQEDMHGTTPKFEVEDSDGKKWSAKLGLEAKPETAAARLLWAVGYSANENYLSLNWRSGTCPLSFDVFDPWREKTGTFPMFACNVGRAVTRRVANG